MDINDLWEKIIFFYFFTFAIRSLIHLITQCVYLSLCNYSQDINNYQKNKESIENSIELISNLMSNYGQIHRTLATTGVFYYCLLFFSAVIFYLIRALTKGEYLNYRDELGFIAFIKNPRSESFNISSKIEASLNNLIFSNLNYGRIIFARSFKTVTQLNKYECVKVGQKEAADEIQNLPLSTSGKKSCTQIDLHPGVSIYRTTTTIYSNNRHLIYSYDLINSLKCQLSFITELFSNKAKVWPPNRNPLWARELTKFSLSIYVIVGSIIWFVAELGSFMIIYNVYKTINKYDENDNILSKNENKFTFFDRLCSVDYIIYAYFGADLFTTPLIVSITSIEDQLKFLDTFEPRLRRIFDRTKQLEQINSHIKSSSNLNPNSSLGSISSKNRKRLKVECDQEAIEMYISYQLFRDEVAPSIKLAQNAVGLHVTLAICCLLPTLFYYRDIPTDQLLAFACLCSSIILSINGTFCMCAALHVNCSRVSKLIWSFIAIAESYNYREYSIFSIEDINTNEDENQDQDSGVRLGLFCAKDVNETPPDSSYLKYYAHSLVTPHTVLLWRRLAESDELIIENFVCKLYGIFDITYKGILRINYLLIISILYTLTYNG